MMATRNGAAAPAALLATTAAAVRVRQDLPCLDQEVHPGGGQRDVVGAQVSREKSERRVPNAR
jgi:hypothetical protein